MNQMSSKLLPESDSDDDDLTNGVEFMKCFIIEFVSYSTVL